MTVQHTQSITQLLSIYMLLMNVSDAVFPVTANLLQTYGSYSCSVGKTDI